MPATSCSRSHRGTVASSVTSVPAPELPLPQPGTTNVLWRRAAKACTPGSAGASQARPGMVCAFAEDPLLQIERFVAA